MASYLASAVGWRGISIFLHSTRRMLALQPRSNAGCVLESFPLDGGSDTTTVLDCSFASLRTAPRLLGCILNVVVCGNCQYRVHGSAGRPMSGRPSPPLVRAAQQMQMAVDGFWSSNQARVNGIHPVPTAWALSVGSHRRPQQQMMELASRSSCGSRKDPARSPILTNARSAAVFTGVCDSTRSFAR